MSERDEGPKKKRKNRAQYVLITCARAIIVDIIYNYCK